MPDLPASVLPPAPPDAETYGVYRVLRPLGEGASGRVFLAERTDFAQRVALKVFRPAFFSDAVAAAAEPHLLASLDHRHIVRVLGGGATPAGVRYLAMEYVAGEDILTFCDSRRLPLTARVRLLLQVLQAVEHAHRRLVLHGDLKPANILVAAGSSGDAEAEPQAKLVDFGSAAGLGFSQSSAGDTPSGYTAAFASPEQRAGGRVTVASDIYSLGLLARLLLHEVPAGPAQHRDVAAILHKALESDPAARYSAAEVMAEDLCAVAEGRTPAVRHAPVAERLRKWTLRNKLRAAMAAVLACVLLFSAAGVTVKAAQARRSRREAEVRLRELVQLTGTLQSELYGSVHSLSNAEASEKLLTDAVASTLDQLAASQPTDPTLRAELAAQYTQLARLELGQAPASGASPAGVATARQHLLRSLSLTAPGDPRLEERRRLLASVPSASQ